VRPRRVLRAVRKAVKLRRLINTLAIAIPSVANVGSLLLLMQFMYAIVGVQLFALVQHGSYLNDLANFETFWTALLTLVRSCCVRCCCAALPSHACYFSFVAPRARAGTTSCTT
jgi:hypothetical protein